MRPHVAVERTRHGPFERIVLRAETLMGPAQVSVYRVGDTLVDAGGTAVTSALLGALEERPPKRIVCTHQHEDHVGNLGPLRRALGDIPIFVPRAHIPIIQAVTTVPEYRAYFWGHPDPDAPLIPYDPGDVFEEGKVALTAVETPGHTPHHVALVAEAGDDVFALTGDLYTAKPLSAWYESACDDTIASYRLLARRGGALRMLPTHGRTRDDAARLFDDSADELEREAEKVQRAKESLGTSDPRAIAASIYPRSDPMDRLSGGEISRAAFVRSVLDPVRSLPAKAP